MFAEKPYLYIISTYGCAVLSEKQIILKHIFVIEIIFFVVFTVPFIKYKGDIEIYKSLS